MNLYNLEREKDVVSHMTFNLDVTTKHLHLVTATMQEYASDFARISRDARVRQQLVYPPGTPATFFEKISGNMAEMISITSKGEGTVIGFASVSPMLVTPGVDIAMCLDPAHWGKHYGTEAMRALTKEVLLQLCSNDVYVAVAASNWIARQVLESLGYIPASKTFLHGKHLQ